MNSLFDFTQDHARKIAAWNRASVVPGYDPGHARKDAFGSWIVWSEYGNRDSQWGWEIDHRTPTALGGSDRLNNLRALHWRNNAGLGGVLGSLFRS